MNLPAAPDAPTEYVYRCTTCGDTRVTTTKHPSGGAIRCWRTPNVATRSVRCGGRYVLDSTPSVPEGWHRDAAPRELRERFVDAVRETILTNENAGNAAWQLILDAWRVIDVASARGDCRPNPCREEWMAALQVAIFRAEHPETTAHQS